MVIRRIVVVLLLSILFVPPASAHRRATLDQDDSPGPLDIVATQLSHPQTRIKLLVVTYEEWNDATLSGEVNYVRFDLDRRDKRGIQRCVVIHLHPPGPPEPGPTEARVQFYRRCDSPIPYYEPIDSTTSVVRPDQHSLALYVDRNVLWKRRLRELQWRAITSYEHSDHPDCQPPDPDAPPPEHFFGSCYDETRWRRH